MSKFTAAAVPVPSKAAVSTSANGAKLPGAPPGA
jgi:hypothetical protein